MMGSFHVFIVAWIKHAKYIYLDVDCNLLKHALNYFQVQQMHIIFDCISWT
jgi:hypothetical protein